MKKNSIALAILVIMVCSSCSTISKKNKKENSGEDVTIELEKKHGYDYEKVPAWFLEPPQSGEKIYAASSGVSSILQLSLDKAVLNAKYELASQVRNRISGKSQSFLLEEGFSNNSTRHTQTKTVKREFLKEINVGGYSVEKKAVHNRDGVFYSYVLLSFQPDSNNSAEVLNSSKAAETTEKLADKEFQNLENSIRIETFPIE